VVAVASTPSTPPVPPTLWNHRGTRRQSS